MLLLGRMPDVRQRQVIEGSIKEWEIESKQKTKQKKTRTVSWIKIGKPLIDAPLDVGIVTHNGITKDDGTVGTQNAM
jgi:hypothetical protein